MPSADLPSAPSTPYGRGGRSTRMRTIKLTLSYDGTDFAGWQRQQSGRRSRRRLKSRSKRSPARGRRRWPAEGPMPACMPWARSSAFARESRLPAEVLRRALNAELPHSVAVLDAAEVHDEFSRHARCLAEALPLRDPQRADPRRLRPPLCLAFRPRAIGCRGHAAGRRGADRHARLQQFRDHRSAAKNERPHGL